MQLLKNYFIEKASEEIQKLAIEDQDISISFDIFSYEEGFNLGLTRDGDELSFFYFEEELSFEIYNECYENFIIKVSSIDNFEYLKEAIDLLVVLFIHENWHESVGIFMVSDFWNLVELSKIQKLDLSLGYPCMSK